MPTIRQHIRERGFDHTLVIAKELCARRRLAYAQLLGRARNTVQVGSDRTTRLEQVKHAYRLILPPSQDDNYLVIDDVWTTGASLCSACSLLRENGAHNVMVAVIARSIKL